MVDIVDAALRLLTYRPRSRAEVRSRLQRRYPEAEVEYAISALEERGLLDDLAFARFWRESRERRRPRSASAIRWELLRMGVSREDVAEALEGVDDEASAHRAAMKVAGKLDPSDHHTLRSKLSAHLRRRGFSGDLVGEVCRRFLQELPDAVDGHVVGPADHDEPENNADR